jgi:hypothetical protein
VLFSRNLGTLISWNPLGHSRPVTGLLYLMFINTERMLRVFENRVLRRIFGPKRDEVTADWRKLHNEELNDLYCSPSIVRVIKSRRL